MCKLLKIKVDEFNIRSFMRDILNYYRKELNNKDILWWIEGKNEGDISKFDHVDCLEAQLLNYIKQDGNKLFIPFFMYNGVGQAVNINGEIINIYSEGNEANDYAGINIENTYGSYLITTVSREGSENISYIKNKYKVA